MGMLPACPVINSYWTATDTHPAEEEPPWWCGLNTFCTDLMKLLSDISRGCFSAEPLQLSANQPKGAQTSQHGPLSPVFHKDEVGLISLLWNFLLNLSFESAYWHTFLFSSKSLSIRYPKPWIFQGTLMLLWIYKAFLLIFLLLSLQVWKATSSLLRISELIALQHKYPTILTLLHIALERLRLVLLECKFDPLLASKEQPIRNFFRHQVWFVKHPGGSTGPRGAVFFTSSSQ